MEKDSLSSLYDIQLFAEAGESAGTGGAGSPAGQESAALAQPQQKGVNHPGSQANAGRGAAPDAGEQQDDDTRRAARFEALIKGEYKDLYDQRVQDTIRKRLKGSEETARRLSALSPALELLGRRYGVDPADPQALSRAIEAENAPAKPEEKAAEAPERAEQQRQEKARRQLADWLRQAAETRARYPSFDLGAEARDPRFRSLIGSGVPLQTAFEVLHQREILPAAMEYSARRAEEKLADSVIAGQLRPAEGAMGGQSPVLSKRDVSQLTRAEREEIDRRVARGEKIRF